MKIKHLVLYEQIIKDLQLQLQIIIILTINSSANYVRNDWKAANCHIYTLELDDVSHFCLKNDWNYEFIITTVISVGSSLNCGITFPVSTAGSINLAYHCSWNSRQTVLSAVSLWVEPPPLWHHTLGWPLLSAPPPPSSGSAHVFYFLLLKNTQKTSIYNI